MTVNAQEQLFEVGLVVPEGERLSIEEAEDLRREVDDLDLEDDGTWWTLANILGRLSLDTTHVQRWGYTSAIHWLGEEHRFNRRRLQYYLAAWQWNHDNPLSADLQARIARLHWTKARLLTGFITPVNAEAWISRAEKLPRVDLDRQIRAARGQQDAPPVLTKEESKAIRTRHEFRFRLRDATMPDGRPVTGTEYKAMRQALDDAKQLLPSERQDDAAALSMMAIRLALKLIAQDARRRGHAAGTPARQIDLLAMEFLAGCDAGMFPKPVKRLLAELEGELGLKLVAFDATCQRLLYGGRTFDVFSENMRRAAGAGFRIEEAP